MPPDAPGSGPTDPDEVVRLIRRGADAYHGHLRTPRTGQEWWLAVTVDEHGTPRWIGILTKGVGLAADDFDRLARGRCIDKLVHVDGAKYALVPPKPTSITQTAHLVKRP